MPWEVAITASVDCENDIGARRVREKLETEERVRKHGAQQGKETCLG
jgi:hypothetical protein